MTDGKDGNMKDGKPVMHGTRSDAERVWREHKGWDPAGEIREQQVLRDRRRAIAMRLDKKLRDRLVLIHRLRVIWLRVMIAMLILIALGTILWTVRNQDKRECRNDPSCHIYPRK